MLSRSTCFVATIVVLLWLLVAIPRCNGVFTSMDVNAAGSDKYGPGYFTTYVSGWPFAHFETADFDGFVLREQAVPFTRESMRVQLKDECRSLRGAELDKHVGRLFRTTYITSMEWGMLENPNFGPLWLQLDAWKLVGSDYARVIVSGLLANLAILLILVVAACALFRAWAKKIHLPGKLQLKELLGLIAVVSMMAAWWGNARNLQARVAPKELHTADLKMNAPNWLVRLVGTKPLYVFLRPDTDE